MDFLEQIFLDNTVKMYAIVLGTILLALLLKKYLSRYIASVFYRLFIRIWGKVEKKHFIDLVVEPIEAFLLVLVTVFSLDKLNFPAAWVYRIYGVSTEAVAEKIGIGIIVLTFTWLLLRLIDFIAMVLEHKADLTDDQSDNQLIVFFKDFFKVLLVIGGLLAVLKFCFNQAIGPLVTGLGIAGAAIALASKESLENIIASFIIFFDKPFITGDILKVHDITGTVERIGLRSTRIRTIDKTLVSVPNKQMVDSIVDNHTMRTMLRGEVKLLLSTQTPSADAEKVVAAINAILQKNEQLKDIAVFVKDISRSGIQVMIEYFSIPMEQAAFDLLKQEINLGIKKILEENRIIFAAA
jgi:MscS family membrane protein